ncbi:MAG: hypothetical protein AAF203_10865, partial [Pseudomonadota bacterium]
QSPQGDRMPPICSSLDFNNVTWPKDYRQTDQVAFSLAMNITGSFEGHAGWTNLSNNFDGQGVSMGILNQNLGQGTLQPLLIQMRENHLDILESVMTKSMLDSLLKMLKDWERARVSSFDLQRVAPPEVERRLVDLSDEGDIDKHYAFAGISLRSNSKSVRWARKTLYTDSKGRKFKESWRKALKALAGDPAYVSLQIAAARYIHDRTHSYRERLGWTQLRSYLFLFDIVVQNGSLRDKHFEKFDDWMTEQARATEEEQMLEMLEIRVVDSNPKWQKDVRLRKTAVIKGVGYVHGEDRNLPIEYCYDPLLTYHSHSQSEAIDRL